MKPPAQIRQHIADLRTCLQIPCGCTGQHAMECQAGARMMVAVIDTLEWALGENDAPAAGDRLLPPWSRRSAARTQVRMNP